MQSLSSFFEDNKPLASVIILAALLVLIGVVFLLYRVVFGRRLRTATGGRARQPRLGVVDAFDLDRQRQLVLVRRDNVEHLIMIGGPNDIVLESTIVRAQAAGTAAPGRDKELVAPSPAAPQVTTVSAALAPAGPMLPSPGGSAPAAAPPIQPSAATGLAPIAPPMTPPAPVPALVPNGPTPIDRPRGVSTGDVASVSEAGAPRGAQPPPRPTGFVPGQRTAAPPPRPAPASPAPRPATPLPPRPATPAQPRPSLGSTLPPRPARPSTPPPVRPHSPRDVQSGSEPPADSRPVTPAEPSLSAPRPEPAPARAAETTAPRVVEPAPPRVVEAAPRPAPAPAKQLDTLESLEEEMAKLLGRPTPRRDG